MTAQQPGGLGRFRRVRRLLAAQAAVVFAAVAIAWAAAGREAALAAVLGGLVSLVPQAWFAWRVFAADPADPGAMLRALYRGEGIKLAAIALGLVAIFRAWPEVPPLPLILTFIAVQLAHWLAPLLLDG